jgi:hypothetical protein
VEVFLSIIPALYENTGNWIIKSNRQEENRETRIESDADAPGLPGTAGRTDCGGSPGS